MAQSYDFLMNGTERRCLGAWRSEILSYASGDLLEIGAGTGINLRYLPERTSDIYLCEPDQQMRRQLSRKTASAGRRNDRDIRITDWRAESIAMPDASFDTIVSTLVLCSVGCLSTSLNEIYRLLRPNGCLLFMEHIASEQSRVRAWQHRIEPIWSFCAGGCHLTRDTGAAIEETGFIIERLTDEPMAGAPGFVNRTIRGLARKPR